MEFILKNIIRDVCVGLSGFQIFFIISIGYGILKKIVDMGSYIFYNIELNIPRYVFISFNNLLNLRFILVIIIKLIYLLKSYIGIDSNFITYSTLKADIFFFLADSSFCRYSSRHIYIKFLSYFDKCPLTSIHPIDNVEMRQKV